MRPSLWCLSCCLRRPNKFTFDSIDEHATDCWVEAAPPLLMSTHTQSVISLVEFESAFHGMSTKRIELRSLWRWNATIRRGFWIEAEGELKKSPFLFFIHPSYILTSIIHAWPLSIDSLFIFLRWHYFDQDFSYRRTTLADIPFFVIDYR